MQRLRIAMNVDTEPAIVDISVNRSFAISEREFISLEISDQNLINCQALAFYKCAHLIAELVYA